MTTRMKTLVVCAAFLSLAGRSVPAAPTKPVPGPDLDPGPPVKPAVFACRNTVCGVEVVEEKESLPNGDNEGRYSLQAVALCPVGKHAIGGGFSMGGNFNQIAVTRDAPFFVTNDDGEVLDPLPIGWQAGSIRLNEEPLNAGWDIRVWAVCATVD